MTTSAHFPLSASSAARWIACPGSVKMESRYSKPESEASIEGTVAHWVLAEALMGKMPIVGTSHPFLNAVVTEEMIDGAREARWHLKDLLGEAELYIEKQYPASLIHDMCGGTPDVWARIDKTLHIFDYKFGHGFIDAFENWQLLVYAAALILPTDTYIEMHIHQFRNFDSEGSFRTWRIEASKLEFYVDVLHNAAVLALSDAPPLKDNKECKYWLLKTSSL